MPEKSETFDANRFDILLLEDNPVDVQLVEEQLATSHPSMDIRLTKVERLAEGIRRLTQKAFDLALLDLSLPDSAGIDTFHKLREHTQDTPVVVVTGHYDESLALQILRLGAQDYILKNGADTPLSGAIQYAIERNRKRMVLTRRARDLADSEMRVRAIIEASSDAMIVVGRDGQVRYANPTAEVMFRRPASELEGRAFGFPVVTERVTEVDIFYPDGRPGIAEMRVSEMMWDGEPAHIASMRDITARKHVEDKLQLFRELVDQSNDAFEVVDPDTGSFLDISLKNCTDLGYTPEELLALKWFDIDSTVLAQNWSEFAARVRREGSIRGEGIHRRKDGSCFPVEYTIRLARLDREYFVIVARDITERRKAEAQIREQADLLDKASDAIIVKSLKGEIIYWNKGAERILGWTLEEVRGRLAADFLDKNVNAIQQARQALVRNGEWSGETHKFTKEGGEVLMYSRWTLMRNSDGTPHCILSINSDVTEQRKLEAQILRTQRLESIGTLASGIAHDLNNVLTPIVMSFSLLRERIADEEGRSVIDNLEQNAKRGADVVRQVLAFGRGMHSDRMLIDVPHLLKEIDTIICNTFPKAILVEHKTEPNLWAVTGDSTQLHQVLLNLCINARDAMPQGGRLGISVRNVVLNEDYFIPNAEALHGPYVVFEVSDTGIGIPDHIRERIFEPFFTTKELGRGTGLGLSMVSAILKSHGGFIKVYSEEGNGSVFRAYIPATIAAPTPVRKTESTVLPKGSGECILLIDDEQLILNITKKGLERAGYEVLPAPGGAAAIALLKQNRSKIKIIITDMSMPLMDGPTTIDGLRKIDNSIPIIAASGFGPENESVKSVSGIVSEFLQKPYTLDTILLTLHKVLHANERSSP